METKNQGLDSITRRKAIAALLKIPPALLGLASLDDLHKIIQDDKWPQTISSKKETVSNEEIQLYHDALGVFKEKLDQGTLLPYPMEAWINRITIAISKLDNSGIKNNCLTELAKYHMFVAHAYFHNFKNWDKTKQHLDIAKNIAISLSNNELLAIAHYHTGGTYGARQEYLLSRNELDLALNLAKSTSPQVRGNIITYATQAYALTDNSEANRINIRKLLDEAEKCVRDDTDNNSFMTYDTTQHLIDRSDTLISLKRYNNAMQCIDDAEEYFITRKRSIEYLKILRAECYIKQRKPEYEEALRILSQIVADNPQVAYYVGYVARLHKILVASSYGNAPDVVDLGMVLKELHKN